ncbi:hypothetical protein D3C87_646010 [compost metagenome]
MGPRLPVVAGLEGPIRQDAPEVFAGRLAFEPVFQGLNGQVAIDPCQGLDGLQ